MPFPPRAAQAPPEGRSVPVGALLQVEVQLLSVLPPGHEGLGGAPGLAGQRGGGVGCQGQIGGAGGDGGRLWGESSVRRQCAGWGRPGDPHHFDPHQEAGERRREKLPLGNSHGLPKFGWWAFAHPRGWRPLTTCPGRDLRAVTAPSAWPRPGPSTASTHRMGEWESRPERPAQRF